MILNIIRYFTVNCNMNEKWDDLIVSFSEKRIVRDMLFYDGIDMRIAHNRPCYVMDKKFVVFNKNIMMFITIFTQVPFHSIFDFVTFFLVAL